VDPAVMAALEACCDLAPLHNPPNLAGIRACLAALPGVPNVAVFDNTLHHTIAPEVYLYGLPRRFHTAHRVRRYGFHGIAFRSMLAETERVLGQPVAPLRLVLLMLGSGCTANAQRDGQSIAVSTGFTPLEGLVQSTRCGDLDPGAVIALLRAGYSPAELNDLFNRGSGLKGLSGLSADLRDIETADTPAARLAEDVFIHRAIKYVGGYTAELGGLDVLVFGGGIGQHAAEVRARICEPFQHLGLRLDSTANQELPRGASGCISSGSSGVRVVVAAVDEERVIARECHTVVTSAQHLRA
ncbi:MAG: acetate kinase, partial [Armatimonadetes bacterium]|nr:acetate kinase [Armatimonadota bacterium]